KVAVVGISASIALSVTGCVNPFPSVTDGVPMGDVMPPETENETACDTAIQGVEIQTEQGELIVPGEPLPETTEDMTEEPFMGDVIWEGEPTEYMTDEPEETTEEPTDETSEETSEEETTEPEIVDIMGEPAE
ncbi:MAG: hypothetical protein IJD38_10555, partial [Clostridia bacterium]|nr:hypothetical protein [Clostridia bacterium]